MATAHPSIGPGPRSRTSRRLRAVLGLGALAEVAVFVLVAGWIGVGWTVLLTLATSALGAVLLARQGTRALADLRDRAQTRQHPGRALGDAGLVALGGLLMVLPGFLGDVGLVALGGLLMVLPGFLGDVVGLLCLLPFTRVLPRALIARMLLRRLPEQLRGPVRVRAFRAAPVDAGDTDTDTGPAAPGTWPPAGPPRVIEGEVVTDPRP